MNEAKKDNKKYRLNTELIKKKRNDKGYTQKEIAEMMGYSESAYQKWETGSVNADVLYKAEKLSNILELPIESLIITDDTQSWRKPYVPEEYKDVMDIHTTTHDLIDRLPDFLKSKAPTHEMLDYMHFKKKYGESAVLAMENQTTYSIDECNEIKREYQLFMDQLPPDIGENYWIKLSDHWNYKNMDGETYPIGDVGYHRFLVDKVVYKLLFDGQIFNSPYGDIDDVAEFLYQIKDIVSPLKVGKIWRMREWDNNINVSRFDYVFEISNNGDYDVFTEKEFFTLKKLIKMSADDIEVDILNKQLSLKEKIMKLFHYGEGDEKELVATIFYEGLTSDAQDLLTWYLKSHPWIYKASHYDKEVNGWVVDNESELLWDRENVSNEFFLSDEINKTDHATSIQVQKHEINNKFRNFLYDKAYAISPIVIGPIFLLIALMIHTDTDLTTALTPLAVLKVSLLRAGILAVTLALGAIGLGTFTLITYADMGISNVNYENFAPGARKFKKTGMALILLAALLFFAPDSLKNQLMSTSVFLDNKLNGSLSSFDSFYLWIYSLSAIGSFLLGFGVFQIVANILHGIFTASMRLVLDMTEYVKNRIKNNNFLGFGEKNNE